MSGYERVLGKEKSIIQCVKGRGQKTHRSASRNQPSIRPGAVYVFVSVEFTSEKEGVREVDAR